MSVHALSRSLDCTVDFIVTVKDNDRRRIHAYPQQNNNIGDVFRVPIDGAQVGLVVVRDVSPAIKRRAAEQGWCDPRQRDQELYFCSVSKYTHVAFGFNDFVVPLYEKG